MIATFVSSFVYPVLAGLTVGVGVLVFVAHYRVKQLRAALREIDLYLQDCLGGGQIRASP